MHIFVCKTEPIVIAYSDDLEVELPLCALPQTVSDLGWNPVVCLSNSLRKIVCVHFFVINFFWRAKKLDGLSHSVFEQKLDMVRQCCL